MIIELFFRLIFGVFNMILNLIPTIDLDFDFSWISGLGAFFKYVNLFVDLNVILFIISLTLVRDNFTFLKNLTLGIVRKIPFID